MKLVKKFGSHSDSHPHVNNLSYEKNIEEIEKSNDKIEKVIGSRTKLYRAPYGEYNNTVIKAATDKGYYTIQWSLDTLDYTGLTGDEMWNRLDKKLNLFKKCRFFLYLKNYDILNYIQNTNFYTNNLIEI